MINREIGGKYSKPYNYICIHYEFRFNVVSGRFEYRKLNKSKVSSKYDWTIYDDRVKSTLLLELSEQDMELPDNKLNMFVESESVADDYNPFLEYFEELKPWDGKIDYIDQLAKTLKTDNDDRFGDVLKRFLVGSLDCLLNEDTVNDVCLVFQSSQGIGKTRWMRKLLPDKFQKEYLYEGNIDTKNKDHTQYLSLFWFIHLDELETLKSNDISAIKSFITRQRISLRSAYGRYKSNYIRRASFLGSVNDDKFLTDTTGNRRWLVFKTFKIDYQHNIDIDGLWAQVFSYWDEGFKHWFDIDEIKEINKQNEKFRDISLEEELILKNFDFVDESDTKGEWLSCSEVMMKISANTPQMMNKMRANIIGKVLTLRSGDLKRRKEGVSKYWVKFIGIEPEEISYPNNNIETETKTTVGEPDELPF